jgi:hypothetical protein
MDAIKGGLHACESHLDDLEEWLAVFSIKMANMRKDIHVIEERNNELEIGSRNNVILMETLKVGWCSLKPVLKSPGCSA